MKKIPFAVLCILLSIAASSQNNLPRLEVYSAPGFFFEGLNDNALVPKNERNASRLGDDISVGIAATFALNKSRWLIKGGLGYRARHYSMAKYNLDDFFVSLFLFDAGPLPRDTFALARVRFTNQYFDVPLSIAYALTRRKQGLPGFTVGVNIHSNFLLKSSAQITADSSILPLPSQQQTNSFKNIYTKDATKYAVTVEPYLETSFFIYKGIGLMQQLRPISFYSSRMNNKFTVGTVELFGFTVGVIYDFNR